MEKTLLVEVFNLGQKQGDDHEIIDEGQEVFFVTEVTNEPEHQPEQDRGPGLAQHQNVDHRFPPAAALRDAAGPVAQPVTEPSDRNYLLTGSLTLN